MTVATSYRGVRIQSVILPALLVAVLSMNGAAQAKEKVLTGADYPKLEKLCHDFHAVMPPPPPVEAILIGTLDYASGHFTWGPKVYEKKTDDDSLIIDLSQPWKDMKIRAIRPNLDPQFTTLSSAWGSSPGVLNMINQAIHINVGSAGGPGGVVGSGATSGGGAGDTAAAPAPTATPRGRAPAGAAKSVRTPPPKTGGGNLANANLTEAVPQNQLGGHSTKFRKLYAPVRSGCVDMVFRVINRPADAQVTITAEGRSASANGDQIDLLVPARVWVPFSLTCGDKKFDDLIILDRPPVLGCFTLEAMPLTIIYEPPGTNSSQKLITTKSIGTTLETFTSTESSGTAPVTTDFSTVTEAIDLIGKVGEGVEKVNPKAGAAIKVGGEVLSAAWGSSKTDKEVSNTVTDSRKLSMQVTTEDWGSTSTHQGPGKGDVFHYLIKPTFLWLAVSDEKTGSVYITVSLLGYKSVGRMSADLLRSGANPIPPKDMQLAMLKLDPMAPEYDGGATGNVPIPDVLKKGTMPSVPGALSRRRLVFTGFYSFGGSDSGMSIERKIEEEDTHTSVNTETVTTTESAGFLSYVAKNVPKDGEKKMSTVQGTSHGAQASDTVKIEVQYGTGENATEFHNINVYYDTLFGTFAFEEADVSEDQQISGQAMTAEDEPAKNQRIALIGPDGTTTIASTDDKGNFKIGSPSLKKGTYVLKIGEKEIPFEFAGLAVKDMKLEVGAGTAEMESTGQAVASGRKTKVGKGGLAGAEGSASQPTVKETGDSTAGAIRGRPDTSATFTSTPNPKLKGRLGRIVVAYPKDTPCKDTHVAIRKPGEEANLKTFYGGGETELMPGKYVVLINSKPVNEVVVQSRNDTKIRTGVLHVNAGKDTHIQLLDADGKTKLDSDYGEQQWGLPVGKYHLQIAGQTEAVEVTEDQVTEF